MLFRSDWVPRLVRDNQRRLRNTWSQLEVKLGRQATEEEVANELGIPLSQLSKIMYEVDRASIHNLEDLRTGNDEQRLMDVLKSTAPDTIDTVALQQRRKQLAQSIDSLPDRERKVISLYYYESLTYKEIGNMLGVSETRAYQLHNQATNRLRNYLESEADRKSVV